MSTKIMMASLLLVLAILNNGIYQKEQIKKHGETLLLELDIRDPRSRMQGDYLHLRYSIESKISAKESKQVPHQKRGYIVVRPDKQHVAQFVRFYKGEQLNLDEKLMKFHPKKRGVSIFPNTFCFQEGHAKYYQNAKYGVFKFGASGDYILIGLANASKKIIKIADS